MNNSKIIRGLKGIKISLCKNGTGKGPGARCRNSFDFKSLYPVIKISCKRACYNNFSIGGNSEVIIKSESIGVSKRYSRG